MFAIDLYLLTPFRLLLNPLIFNCWCSVCVPLLLPELVVHSVAATLPVGRLFHRSLQLRLCCLLHLLRFWSCWCPIACVNCSCCAAASVWWSKFLLHLNICAVAMASYVCQCSVLCYHVKRSFLEYRQQVVNTTRSRSVACAHIEMWTLSECGGFFRALRQQTLLHVRKVSLCITVHHRQSGQSSSFVFVYC